MIRPRHNRVHAWHFYDPVIYTVKKRLVTSSVGNDYIYSSIFCANDILADYPEVFFILFFNMMCSKCYFVRTLV